MSTNKIRTITAGILLAAAALAAYWYWSPFLAMRSMATAATQHDAERFNEYVDYPRLRESLKGQFAAKIGQVMAKTARDNPFAGLGVLLGGAIVDRMVEMMVRPEFVMRAMTEGKLAQPGPGAAPARDAAPPADQPAKEPRWEYVRTSVDKLLAYPVDPDRPAGAKEERPALVFERSGFAHWKLTELRLPQN